MSRSKQKFFNIPNSLSILRIFLIPVFIICFLKERDGIATIVLLLSGLTDFVDGYIARHFNQVTEIGKMLDPFADKLTQAVVAILLALRYPQITVLLALFVIKEICMLLGGFIMIKHGVRPTAAQWWGKLATMVFYVVMIIIVAFGGGLFGITIAQQTIVALTSIAAIFMIFSFINYIPFFIKYLSGAYKKD